MGNSRRAGIDQAVLERGLLNCLAGEIDLNPALKELQE
jgi:hypothetical protein